MPRRNSINSLGTKTSHEQINLQFAHIINKIPSHFVSIPITLIPGHIALVFCCMIALYADYPQRVAHVLTMCSLHRLPICVSLPTFLALLHVGHPILRLSAAYVTVCVVLVYNEPAEVVAGYYNLHDERCQFI